MKAKNIRQPERPCLSIVVQLAKGWDFSNRVMAGIGRYLAENRDWPVRIRRVEIDWWPDDRGPTSCDGMITQITSHDHAEQVRGSGIPAVNITGMAGLTEPMPAALTDFHRGGEMAAEFLLDRGYVHFATWIAHLPSDATEPIYQGFQQRVERAGFHCRRIDQEFTADQDGATRHAPAQLIIRSLERQTALLFAIDNWAETVIDAAEVEGVAIPEELAIIGVGDDRHFTELARPQMTSVNMAFAERGYIAMEMLRQLIDGRPVDPLTRLIEPRGVVERQSTRLTTTHDPEVLAAVRFIRQHADLPITVDDVMECVTCSRRTLEHRFEEHLGRSIHHEIWHAHVELAKQMLTETDLELIEIASQTGFASRSTFNNVFKSRTGVTPMQFRRVQKRNYESRVSRRWS